MFGMCHRVRRGAVPLRVPAPCSDVGLLADPVGAAAPDLRGHDLCAVDARWPVPYDCVAAVIVHVDVDTLRLSGADAPATTKASGKDLKADRAAASRARWSSSEGLVPLAAARLEHLELALAPPLLPLLEMEAEYFEAAVCDDVAKYRSALC